MNVPTAAITTLLAERGPLFCREIIAALPQYGREHLTKELHAMMRDGLIEIDDKQRWTIAKS